MFESFLIVFRESLEAALIVGIVMAFLKKNGKQALYPLVLTSIGAAIGASLFGAFLFSLIAGGFTGSNEAIFEGITMILASGFLTYMIVWLYQQKNAKKALEAKLMQHTDTVHKAGLFFLVFFAILREGIETVLFMNAIAFNTGQVALWGGFLGLFAALVIGYLLFVVEIRLPIKKFFQFSGIMLIFFAAGLLAHGVHELQEAGIVPIIVEHLYDINHIFNEKSTAGEFAKGIFGYNGNPSLIEIAVYLAYLGAAFKLFFEPKKAVIKA